MYWQLQQQRRDDIWVVIRAGDDAGMLADWQRWLASYQGVFRYRLQIEDNREDECTMADRKTDAYADGLKLAHGLLGVFATLPVPENRALFGLGYSLAKASGYLDADAAMSFIEGFTNAFDAERQKRLPAPEKELE